MRPRGSMHAHASTVAAARLPHMSDAPETTTPRKGFSSRWILDRDGTGAAPRDASPRSVSGPIDTDGDGIADTLDVRIDATPGKPGAMRSLGAWLGRSILTLVFVAALVAAGVAATAAFNAREQATVAEADLRVAEERLADAQRELEVVREDLAEAREAATTGAADAAEVEGERDELLLEVTVLRRMLLDAERRAADG